MLWNSSNPIGAVLSIEIPIDDASVICSDFSNNQWKFTTTRTPWDYDHPVSGNREFGYTINPDWSYTFYTRGIDRFTQLVTGGLPAWIFSGGNPFSGADQLWESFQNGISNFVNRNGGNASILPPIKWRPNWAKVKNDIEGKRPITDLGCE